MRSLQMLALQTIGLLIISRQHMPTARAFKALVMLIWHGCLQDCMHTSLDSALPQTVTDLPVADTFLHFQLKCTRSLQVLINAGQANAATGDAGYQDCLKSAEAVAQALGIDTDQVLIESTGTGFHKYCLHM